MLQKRPNLKEVAGGDALPVDDHILVERVRAGQTQSYGELVQRYQDRIFNTCWRICGHLEDARDLTQEAFIKAYESLDGYRRESGFYTWIFRVATNLAISHRRNSSRRKALVDGRLKGAISQADALMRRQSTGTEGEPSDPGHEQASRIATLLQQLDDEQRAVVVLRDIEGLDYAQIGSILGLPAGTVKSRLHRARMALRGALTNPAQLAKEH